VETEKQKGKRLASANENLTQYSTPSKKSKRGPQPHPAEDTRKIAIIGKEHMHQQALKN
jgi:hypothetical protein